MKKKRLVLFIVFSFFIPLVVAANLEIEKVDKGSVVIAELDNPAVFDFIIDNLGNNDSIEIYSFVGVIISPKGNFDLPSGKSTVEVKFYPNKEIRQQKGFFTFNYEIKGQNSGIFKDRATIKIVPLKQTLEVKAGSLHLGDKEAVISIKNVENTNLDNFKIKFRSVFFDSEKTISLKPYQETNISLNVDMNKSNALLAGPYIFNAEIALQNAKTILDGTIDYVEKKDISMIKESSGFIVYKTTITKTNEGNVPSIAQIDISKDIISRLFTIYSAEPINIQRNGLFARYVWEKELKPAEFFSINVTTNYTIPFIFVLLVIIIAFLVRMYTRTSLVINKRVSFVKTKGGEFALKVRLSVKARKYVEKIQIIDKLPGMTQLYEKFGIKPDKIDPASRRLFWNIDRLNVGEERIYSYIIYSKVRAVGRFELPAAMGIFEREGKTHEVLSNKTFFVSETAEKAENY